MFGLIFDKNKKIPEGKSESCFSVGTHQTVAKELVLKKANCSVASHRTQKVVEKSCTRAHRTDYSQLAFMLALA